MFQGYRLGAFSSADFERVAAVPPVGVYVTFVRTTSRLALRSASRAAAEALIVTLIVPEAVAVPATLPILTLTVLVLPLRLTL